MTSTKILAAVDGGGTKTCLRLFTETGETIAEVRDGPANIASDAKQAWDSVREALDQALRLGAVDTIDCWAMGLAGAESACGTAEFLALIPKVLPTPVLVSDAYIACLGAHGGNDGAVVSVGTGTVGYALTTESGITRAHRVSGWGFPQGDEGSGAWIGREVVASMLQAQDGRLPSDALTEACYGFLSESCDPLAWSIGRRAQDFATLAPLVVKYAAEGCESACAILRHAAVEVSRVFDALHSIHGCRELSVCLLGGLANELMPYFDSFRKNSLKPSLGDALDGASILARQSFRRVLS